MSEDGKVNVPGGAPADLVLPRGRALLVGTGAFGVSTLPSWALLLRASYGWSVRACLTYSATALVSRQALAAATQAPVSGPEWATEQGVTPHQELAEWPDVVIVVPATVNFVAKCALGIPDNLALNVVMSTTAPVVLVPSIPEHVLPRPSLRRHLAALEEEGYHVVPTQRGISVHSGKTREGGMADIGTTLRFVTAVMAGRGAPLEPTPN